MKNIIKGAEPQALLDYKLREPDSSWKTGFKKNAGQQPVKDVYNSLYLEQHGLCVYCEIDLKDGLGRSLNDFRVEHFYPENPNPKDVRNDQINYALYWPNMFGCCHGGSVKAVVDSAERHCQPNCHCDVPKANHDWTNKILNPISDIPKAPAIFKFNEDGHIFVNEELCPENIKAKANGTIELLNLNAKKLVNFRRATIEKLQMQLSEVPDEMFDKQMEILASCYLKPDQDGGLEAFFSTIRWYLGPAAEEILT